MRIAVMSLRGRGGEPERTIVCWREEGDRKNKQRNEQLVENKRDGE